MELEVVIKTYTFTRGLCSQLANYPQGQVGHIFVSGTVSTQERNHEFRNSGDLRGYALSLVQPGDKVSH